MKELFFKELCFIKTAKKKLCLYGIIFWVGYIYTLLFKDSNWDIFLCLIWFLGYAVIVVSIEKSVLIEKDNQMISKMKTMFSLNKIWDAKVLVPFIIATIVQYSVFFLSLIIVIFSKKENNVSLLCCDMIVLSIATILQIMIYLYLYMMDINKSFMARIRILIAFGILYVLSEIENRVGILFLGIVSIIIIFVLRMIILKRISRILAE